MRVSRRLAMLFTLFLPLSVSAHNLVTGERVTPVSITDKGELRLQQEKFSYEKWNSSRLAGKVRVIQHVAGRSSAKVMNAALTEAIKTAQFPHDRYQTTTIVNTDDALPGTGLFVRSSIENNKKQYPWSQFIVDDNGMAKKAWDLEDGGSAIVVLDKTGRIRFAKDGSLTQKEVKQVITLLRQLLEP